MNIRSHPAPAGGWTTLISSVPYPLGVPPVDSLVILGLEDDDLVIVSSLSNPFPDADAAHIHASLNTAMRFIRGNGANTLVLIGFGERAAEPLQAAVIWAEEHRIPAGPVLHVTDGRYRCCCEDPRCPDRGGAPYDPNVPDPAEPADGTGAAERS